MLTIWLKGVLSGAVSGVATVLLLYFSNLLDVEKVKDWKNLLLVIAIGALVGVSNYLKQSPIPKDE
jgi:hypothetical protein